MSKVLEDISRTFNEFLLLPNLTDERCIPSKVSLKTPLVKFKKGEDLKNINGLKRNKIHNFIVNNKIYNEREYILKYYLKN